MLFNKKNIKYQESIIFGWITTISISEKRQDPFSIPDQFVLNLEHILSRCINKRIKSIKYHKNSNHLIDIKFRDLTQISLVAYDDNFNIENIWKNYQQIEQSLTAQGLIFVDQPIMDQQRLRFDWQSIILGFASYIDSMPPRELQLDIEDILVNRFGVFPKKLIYLAEDNLLIIKLTDGQRFSFELKSNKNKNNWLNHQQLLTVLKKSLDISIYK